MNDVGLSVKQLRKLTPGNGYTDKQLMTTKSASRYAEHNVVVGAGFWSNGYVVLFEAPPKGAEPAPKTPEQTEQVNDNVLEWLVKAEVQVWPVEMRDANITGVDRALRFTDGNGFDVWMDPKYILAMLKRAGKKAHEATFYVKPDKVLPVLQVKNGHAIGLVAGLGEAPKGEAEWSFKYTGPFPDRFGNVVD